MSSAMIKAASDLRGLRGRIIEAAAATGEGHIPSSLSILDILWVLYDRVLKIDAKAPKAVDRDRFVLSKGHASLGFYAVLAAKGFFAEAELDTFAKFDSFLGGHPDTTKVPGVEASTGSLGHGFPIAAGMALGLRIQRQPAQVYCLIGDGESNEGSVWEAALLAGHHRLSNLCCVVDYNHSTDRALNMGDIGAKFAAFGWTVRNVDGHDHEALFQAFTSEREGAPLCVVAQTVKGNGCSLIENQPGWHHRCPTPAELPQLLECLA